MTNDLSLINFSSKNINITREMTRNAYLEAFSKEKHQDLTTEDLDYNFMVDNNLKLKDDSWIRDSEEKLGTYVNEAKLINTDGIYIKSIHSYLFWIYFTNELFNKINIRINLYFKQDEKYRVLSFLRTTYIPYFKLELPDGIDPYKIEVLIKNTSKAIDSTINTFYKEIYHDYTKDSFLFGDAREVVRSKDLTPLIPGRYDLKLEKSLDDGNEQLTILEPFWYNLISFSNIKDMECETTSLIFNSIDDLIISDTFKNLNILIQETLLKYFNKFTNIIDLPNELIFIKNKIIRFIFKEEEPISSDEQLVNNYGKTLRKF